MGKNLIIIGAVIVLIGVVYQYYPKALTWFGKLPGDVRIERTNTRIYFPITSIIIVSLCLNLVLYIVRKL